MPGLTSFLPPLQWLREYQLPWLRSDAVAGITLAAYAIPVSLAYASLAGLPPEYGIYCYLAGGLGYALLGTSRQLAIGPTSAISLLVGATVAPLAGGDAGRFAAIAALAALLVTGLCVLAWLFRLGGLVNFISETILTGFKAGAALTIALTQLPKLFGVPGGGSHFFERLWILLGQLGQTNLTVLLLGLAALGLLIAGDRLLPGRPVALGVTALSILAVTLGNLAERGVQMVGEIPPGLPNLAWPGLRLADVDGALTLAGACFLLAYVEGVAAARTLAERHGATIDPRQELLGLGGANLAAAVCQGYPVAGGLTQSVVNDKAGAKSPLALVFASTVIGGCLIWWTGLLRQLPQVVLAAIVLVAVAGLIDVPKLRRLWRINRSELGVAVVAFSGVLLLGILRGVLVAVLASLLYLLSAAARPHVALLGRIPGTRRYSDLQRHPDNEQIPGVLIFRVESSLLYFNVEHVRAVVRENMPPERALRLVICDLSNAPLIDSAGAAMLSALHQELASRGARLRVVEVRSRPRDLLRAAGLEEQVGYLGRHLSVDQALAEFQTPGESTLEPGTTQS